jgi:hypothetical protein
MRALFYFCKPGSSLKKMAKDKTFATAEYMLEDLTAPDLTANTLEDTNMVAGTIMSALMSFLEANPKFSQVSIVLATGNPLIDYAIINIYVAMVSSGLKNLKLLLPIYIEERTQDDKLTRKLHDLVEFDAQGMLKLVEEASKAQASVGK